MNYKIFSQKNENLKEKINVIIEYSKKDEEYYNFIKYIKNYNNTNQIMVKREHEDIMINKNEIIYFFSDKKNNYCKTIRRTYKVKSKLYELEKENTEYLRISKSYIINTEKLKKFDMSVSGKIMAVMEDGTKIIVSRRRVKDVKEFLDERSI